MRAEDIWVEEKAKEQLLKVVCNCWLSNGEIADIMWLEDSVTWLIENEIDRCNVEEAQEYIKEIEKADRIKQFMEM